jgi:hypothetical protein
MQPLQLIFLETCQAFLQKRNSRTIIEWKELELVWHNILTQLSLKRDHLLNKSQSGCHRRLVPSEWIPSELLSGVDTDIRKNTVESLWLLYVGHEMTQESLLSALTATRAQRIAVLQERIKNPPTL